MQNEKEQVFSEKYHNHLGPVLGVLLILLLVLLGGLYLWGSMIAGEVNIPEVRTIPNQEPETQRAVADQQILDTVSSSNEIDAIYADLESTNLSDLDSDLNAISTEIDTLLQ